jgi:phenylacetate-CoA ligase
MNKLTDKIFGSKRFITLSKDLLAYNKYYFHAKKLLHHIGSFDEKDIHEYQYKQLKKLIEHTAVHVPYYRELFKKVGFKPEMFKKLEDIRHIPYLTKSIIKENRDELIADTFSQKYLKSTITGGSTGTPMDFYLDRRTSSPIEFAYLQYIWGRVGYRFRSRCVVLRGDNIDNIVEGKIYWKKNTLLNWLLMSSFRLNENNVHLYLKKIKEFNPEFIIAYPSMAYILARYVKAHNITFPKLRAVICSSETLYSWQRQFINSVFGVSVFPYYGLSEKCCIAAECPNTGFYEFIPTYGFTEIVNRAGTWCSEDNEMGEIVSTSLYNYAFPFIRYKTQDYCTYSALQCSEHKGWTTVKEIKGRISEFLVNKNGDLITFTCSDEIFWTVYHKLNAYQYVQEIPGKVEIKLDLKEALTEADYAYMNSVFKEYYPDIEVSFQTVSHIPRTSSGKFRFLIQKLPIDFSN